MSSGPGAAQRPSDVWHLLALLRDGEYCQADWQRRLGAGFAPVAEYLEVLAGSVAETFPHPRNGLPLIPRRVHDGTYTARPDDPEVTRVQAVRGIEPAAVRRWRLRWETIGRAIAGALGIEAHAGVGPFETPWVRSIGVRRTRDANLDVLLLVARSEAEALGWVRHLLRGGPRVLILSSHEPLCAELAAAHGLCYLALDRDTRFVYSQGQWELKALAGLTETGVRERAHFTAATAKAAEKALAPVVEVFRKASLVATPPHQRKWWQNVRVAYDRALGSGATGKWQAVARTVVTGAIEESKKPVKDRRSDYLTPLMLKRLIGRLNAPGASRATIETDYAEYLRRRVTIEEAKAAKA